MRRSKKERYVLGIAFNKNGEVVLILKSHGPEGAPEMKGKLNFPGGKVKPGETPVLAMYREWVEEVGHLDRTDLGWTLLATFGGESWEVYVFVSRVVATPDPRCFIPQHHGKVSLVVPESGEERVWCVSPQYLVTLNQEHVMSSVPWLLFLALDKDERKGLTRVSYIK